MKRILLLSDTHGFIDDQIFKFAKEADEIWHAGDIGDIKVTDALTEIAPVRAVYGNIDGRAVRLQYPLNNRFALEGVDVWITHIGGYPGRYAMNVRNEIKINPPKLFICGHSHILKVMSDKSTGLLHMNPGAAGHHGFHKVRTMLRFVLDAGSISGLEIIELGKRGVV